LGVASAPDLSTPGVGAGLFTIPVRVYFQDTDAGGVVYHARYLDFFERCRMEWLRHLGVECRTLAAKDGVLFIVRSLEIEYARPARLDDALEVGLRVEIVGGAQLVVRQQVARGEDILASGRVHLACVAAEGLRPARMPPNLRQTLAAWLPSEPLPERP
jgi:acyl-CoA thioester hydrolase